MSAQAHHGPWRPDDCFLFPDRKTVYCIEEVSLSRGPGEETIYEGSTFNASCIGYATGFIEMTESEMARRGLVHYMGPSTKLTAGDSIN